MVLDLGLGRRVMRDLGLRRSFLRGLGLRRSFLRGLGLRRWVMCDWGLRVRLTRGLRSLRAIRRRSWSRTGVGGHRSLRAWPRGAGQQQLRGRRCMEGPAEGRAQHNQEHQQHCQQGPAAEVAEGPPRRHFVAGHRCAGQTLHGATLRRRLPDRTRHAMPGSDHSGCGCKDGGVYELQGVF